MTAPVHPGGPQQFRKKPVVIEAVRLDGTNREDVARWISENGGEPTLPECAPTGMIYAPGVLCIVTLEGEMWAQVEDWIIRGVAGEFYPCKPDIFAATYEAADGSTPQAPTVDETPAEFLSRSMNEVAHNERTAANAARVSGPIGAAPTVDSVPEARADGAGLIAAERQRQIDAEGWTPEHDDTHTIGELVDAAVCYLRHGLDAEMAVVWPWPWTEDWWKPSDDPIKNLVRAGALIAAEIDRLTRAAAGVSSDR